MTFPSEIFPEDKTDPTVKKQNEMSIEDTLGIIGHVKRATRKRSWRYFVVQPGEDGAAKVRRIRGDQGNCTARAPAPAPAIRPNTAPFINPEPPG